MSNSPLVIFLPDQGQLTHRLARISNLLVHIMEHGGGMLCLNFFKYLKYFPAFSELLGIWYSENEPTYYKTQIQTILKGLIPFVADMGKSEIIKSFPAYEQCLTKDIVTEALRINNDEIRYMAFLFSQVLWQAQIGETKSPGVVVVEDRDDDIHRSLNDPFIKNIWDNTQVIFWCDQTYKASVEVVQKHLPKIKQLFAPEPIITQRAEKIIASAKARADIVIGIHIRLGDYRNWNDGKYAFSTGAYTNCMIQIEALFPGKKVLFIICSNELMDEEDFKPLTTTISPRDIMTDLTLLSLCDFIAGPPSGFTRWASLIGHVPYWQIETPEETFCLDSAKIYKQFA